jgi:hypothetical protein
MKRWFKNNSLSVVLLVLFLIFLVGQSVAGWKYYNDEQTAHTQGTVAYTQYLRSGDFAESVFENWESEFLQMAAYVLLTVFLRQKGSAESKKLEGEMDVDRDPKRSRSHEAPGPVRKGGAVLKLYENSLSLAFALLFVLSFGLHAWGGASATCEENLVHNESCPTVIEYAGSSRFWYESLQNWQSEFLAVFAIVVLSIFLRQRGSPESKPVNTPHHATGTE